MPKISLPARSGNARLILEINDHAYRIKRIKGPNCSVAWRLRKITVAQPCYQVSKLSGCGTLHCTCPDFAKHQHSLGGFRCKHLAALIACGLLSARKPRPSESADRQALKWLSVGEGGVR